MSSEVVWAKMRLCSFWPAVMVKDPPPEIREKGQSGQICVFFFGTKKYGHCNADLVVNYVQHREKHAAKNTRGLKNAVQKCDEFLSDPVKFADHIKDDSTEGTVILQKPMPFQIKQEPGLLENVYLQENVKINSQSESASTSTKCENQHLQNENEKTKHEIEQLKTLISSLTDRYDKELKDLKERINDVTLRYNTPSVVDGKSECTKEVDKYQNEIHELEKKLREQNDEYEELSKLFEQNKEASSKKELLLQNEIESLKNKVIVKDTLYESLLLAKQSTEKEIEKKFEIDFASQISVLTNNLDTMTKKHDELIVANQSGNVKLLEMSTQQEKVLKELSDQNAKHILDLSNKLTEKDAMYEQLLKGKKKIEDEREKDVAKKYTLQISVLTEQYHDEKTRRLARCQSKCQFKTYGNIIKTRINAQGVI